jgi:Zn-dependent protease/CBS domain-containing protein
MPQSLRLGRVAGIPVGANWSVVVILVLIADILATSILPHAEAGRPTLVYWAVALPTAAVFLASLLAHEVAHALVARRKGIPVGSITLWMLGGVTQLGGEAQSPRAELQVAAAGPLTSLAAGAVLMLAAVAAGAAGGPAMIVAALTWAGAMNLLLAVFNLLPGAPLDGGRILRALAWMRHGDRARADRSATSAGKVLGAALAGLGLAEVVLLRQPSGLWLALVGWFLIWSAGMEAQASAVRVATTGVLVGDIMFRDPDCAPAWHQVGEFIATVAVRSRQTVFPVIAVDGEPQGFVTLDRLSRIPAAQASSRIDAVALPLPEDYRVAAGDPASSLLDRRPLAGTLLAVVVTREVVAQGKVVGMVTTDDLRRLVQQSRLRHTMAPSPTG